MSVRDVIRILIETSPCKPKQTVMSLCQTEGAYVTLPSLMYLISEDSYSVWIFSANTKILIALSEENGSSVCIQQCGRL